MPVDRNTLVNAWLDALESGEYPQTTGTLHGDSGYCCLGVLCEVYNKLAPEEERLKVEKLDPLYTYDDKGDYLPERVQQAAGMTSERGNLGSSSLAGMNDNGASFTTVAFAIRENIPTLFLDPETLKINSKGGSRGRSSAGEIQSPP